MSEMALSTILGGRGSRSTPWLRSLQAILLVCLAIPVGCAGPRPSRHAFHSPGPVAATRIEPESRSPVALAGHFGDLDQADDQPSMPGRRTESNIEYLPEPDSPHAATSLFQLERLARSFNPSLRGLQREVAAAQARARYADKLPDPVIGANVFTNPIETAAGSQRANLSVKQMFPWLKRLNAQAQQAYFEALAAREAYRAEELKIVADIRSAWYRLYVIHKQIQIQEANQELLEPLIEVANARVAAGTASQGDVLLGTTELSRLEERLLALRQQSVSTKAELNRLAGRPANEPLNEPTRLTADFPAWSHDILRDLAWQQQPAIAAAHLRVQATRWGLEVAKLKRRPDVAVSANWFAMDDNRPATTVVNVGEDALSIGAQVSIPLWHHKYDAIRQEAAWRHMASHASAEEVMQRYDALLLDLWERAKAARDTVQLYRETILPQARQTLESDQQSYANGSVEFDRVMRNFTAVLTLELAYHRALGELAMTLARIRQAVGVDLDFADGLIRAPATSGK